MVRLKDRNNFLLPCRSYFISIPVWCDWRRAHDRHQRWQPHFNSSMVRLKDIPAGALYNAVIHFNSSMVRLKANWHTDYYDDMPHFNSSMVRLKVLSIAPCLYPIRISIPVWCDWRISSQSFESSVKIEFQFQYGAIEGLKQVRELEAEMEFQFQYGAIEGSLKRSDLRTRQTDFNSSMVRLKVSWGSRCRTGITWFQFQYGAIEGLMWLPSVPDIYLISIPVWCDWRSILTMQPANQLSNFNSSMVRLKVWCRPDDPQCCTRISIPVWCDWRPCKRLKKMFHKQWVTDHKNRLFYWKNRRSH